MKRVFQLVLLGSLPLLACLPGAVTHYQTVLTPLAACEIQQGQETCVDPADAGISVTGSMSVDERGDSTRVFFRQEVMVGSMDNVGRLTVELNRDAVREQNGCATRQRLYLTGLHDDPGFGLRQEINGVFEEGNLALGDPQQCGRNVPYGSLTRYKFSAVETSQP